MSSTAQVPSAWVNMAPGVRRRILGDGEKLMMIQVQLDKNGEVAAHSHHHEQITYVISGRLRFTLGDQVFELAQGDSLFIPSNVVHHVLTLEDALVLDSFSPPREDFR
jgi:quercetin dioxygenase-like cupin family protein